jgi:hypothetical protein
LDRHLKEVSDFAGGFAAAFDSSEWGRLAGLWHDLGKYRRSFNEGSRAVSGHPAENSKARIIETASIPNRAALLSSSAGVSGSSNPR